MPCIFLVNFPESFKVFHEGRIQFFNPKLVVKLKQAVAKAANCRDSDVEVHLSTERYYLLQDNGYTASCPNIHGTVSWFGKEERDATTKEAIAKAIHHFLMMHSLGKDFDLTFLDMPATSFFIEAFGEMIMVPGGEPLPPFQVITDAVGEVTGFKREE